MRCKLRSPIPKGAHLIRVQPCQDWVISDRVSAGVFCVIIKVVKAKPGGDPSKPLVQGWTEIFEADYDNPIHEELVTRTAEYRESAETGFCKNEITGKMETCIFTLLGRANRDQRELLSSWTMAKGVVVMDEVQKRGDGQLRQVWSCCCLPAMFTSSVVRLLQPFALKWLNTPKAASVPDPPPVWTAQYDPDPKLSTWL